MGCILCGSDSLRTYVTLEQIPVHIGIQYRSAAEARACPRGTIVLAQCGRCGHLFNAAFQAQALQYGERYENPLCFSPFFRRYAERTARRLVASYSLRGKTVVEIGCGKGDFLALLCSLGANRGIGFDPSFQEQRLGGEENLKLEVIRDFYSRKYASVGGDLFCARHVLEHIEEPVQFLRMLREAMASRASAVLYLEVPDARAIVEDLSLGDLIYEHVSYFTAESLSFAVNRAGFTILRVSREYGGQFVALDAAVAASPSEEICRQVQSNVAVYEDFPLRFRRCMATWREAVRRHTAGGGKAVVWGAGAKGVMFCNLVPESAEAAYVVDINPYKQGRYVAGTGQKIVPPSFLKEWRPAVVLLLNPNYRSEVNCTLRSLGIDAEVVVP